MEISCQAMKSASPLINALANIVTGFSVVVFQLVGTRIVASTDSENLAVWALAVSLAGFAPLFAFNLNTGVARRAVSFESQATDAWASLICYAVRLAWRYLGVAISAGVLGAMLLPVIYPQQIGTDLVARVLCISGLFWGSCWIVLAQPFQGVLIARQRNVSIAKANLLGRMLALIVLWALIVLTGSLPLALVVCGASLWLSYWLMRRDVPEWRDWATYTAIAPREQGLARITKGFAVWSIAALLFQASLVPIVGVIEPAATAPVYLAVTLMAIVVGVINAGTGAMIAPFGRLVGEEALAWGLRLSWLVSAGLLVYVVLLVWLLPQILEIWVGNAVYAVQVRCYLVLVAGLQCVRSSAAVSSVVLMVKADNRQLVGPSLFELLGLVVLAIPTALIAGTTLMLAVLIMISCIAACATITMAASLNGVRMNDKRIMSLLGLPLGFTAGFVATGFLFF